MDIPALIQQYGYAAVFVGSVLEGETMLVLAGLAAHRGYLSLQWVIAIAVAGAFVGDQICFLTGRFLGRTVLARWPRLEPSVARADALLARGDREAPALLEAQSAADTTDDGKRYAFAAGAARADQATKKRYFEAYLGDPKLAESWIEASLAPFNTSQQSGLTLPFLEPALSELPRWKRTRSLTT